MWSAFSVGNLSRNGSGMGRAIDGREVRKECFVGVLRFRDLRRGG